MDATMVPLAAVLANEELSRRYSRGPRRGAEMAALERLARDLVTAPRGILQKLSDTALELCQAQSAGISLLEEENGRQIFRWHAVSGQWAAFLWATMPREFSPCGTVLDREAAQLMILPERHFTPLKQVEPRVEEVLLVPFSVNRALVGTVWVIAHHAGTKFDSEDRRLVASLAKFASDAYQKLSSLSASGVVQLSRLKAGPPLRDRPRGMLQKRVLIVDDNVDSAEALALLLRSMGHHVHVVHDGRSALNAVPTARPEMVLLDLAMPGMSGFEVAKQLREQLGSAVRIVALTGFGQEEDRAKSTEAGFDQHLVKPIDPSFLKSLLG